MEKLIIPETIGELQEMMRDKKKVAQIVEAGQWPEFTDAYIQKSDKRGELATMVADLQKSFIAGEQAIKTSIDTSVKSSMETYLTTHGVPQRPPLGEPANGAEQNARYNPLAPGTAMNDLGFANLGDFAKTIWHRNPNPDKEKLDKIRAVQNSYSSVDPAAGGFLIPETMRSEVMQLALETSIVRPRATVITLTSLSQLMPYVDSTTNVGSVFGGMIFYWTAEEGTLQQTQAKFGRMRLEANKLTGLAAVPNELWADAPALGSFLLQAVPKGISFFEDIAFIAGSGVGEPLGFLNCGALIAQAIETDQAADTICVENVLKMYSRMLPSSLSNAVWICNQACFPELMTLSIQVGVGGAPVSLVDIRNAPLASMLGRPLIISEKMETLGDQGDLAFVDLSYYLIGDRQAVSLETSDHIYFLSDETALRVIERVDGRPWIQSAFTPMHGSTVSPFVTLAARA